MDWSAGVGRVRHGTSELRSLHPSIAGTFGTPVRARCRVKHQILAGRGIVVYYCHKMALDVDDCNLARLEVGLNVNYSLRILDELDAVRFAFVIAEGACQIIAGATIRPVARVHRVVSQGNGIDKLAIHVINSIHNGKHSASAAADGSMLTRCLICSRGITVVVRGPGLTRLSVNSNGLLRADFGRENKRDLIASGHRILQLREIAFGPKDDTLIALCHVSVAVVGAVAPIGRNLAGCGKGGAGGSKKHGRARDITGLGLGGTSNAVGSFYVLIGDLGDGQLIRRIDGAHLFRQGCVGVHSRVAVCDRVTFNGRSSLCRGKELGDASQHHTDQQNSGDDSDNVGCLCHFYASFLFRVCWFDCWIIFLQAS